MLDPARVRGPNHMSVQIPPSGTRGAFFPRFPSWLAERLNRMAAHRFRQKGGSSVRGVPSVILETTGAKSGVPRQAIVGHVAYGPDTWLIIASAAGAARHPQWLFNLAKDPVATLEFGDGHIVAVKAETLTGPELEAAWGTIASAAPGYVGYRTKTDREIPVVLLRRAA
jgi:deazaflavin-dependent oxidoreductase (nitroreductase family)